jgi:tripartite-type tricarboxylate transporter receptor subunit TctC
VDVLTRGLARELTKDLKVSVIVQNIPGGGSRIGASNVFRAKPDGYTMGTFVIGSLIIPQILSGDAPYDVRKFVWVGSPFSAPFAVWVAAKSGMRTLQDLKKQGEKLGRPIYIAEIGVTATPVPPTVLLMKALNVKYKYVTGYGGQAVMNPAVIRGEVDLLLRTIPSQRPWYGDVQNIATLGPKRHPLSPDVPTVEEQLGAAAAKEILPLSIGVYLIASPPGTPVQAAQVLEKAVLKALESPRFLKWAKKAGFGYDLTKSGSAETKKIVDTYIAGLKKNADTMKAVMKLYGK